MVEAIAEEAEIPRSTEMPVKQVIVIRSDLNMRRGKEITQGAHAAMAWLTKRLGTSGVAHGYEAEPKIWADCDLSQAEWAWVSGSFTKIVCQVGSEAGLLDAWRAASEAGLKTELIRDIGKTEFHGESTYTCVAIGPDWAHLIDPVTESLELY